ncbi:co-regulatory protein PtrA N-terminal domain-containing protein [Pseudomonas sp. NPDC087612]|uniref:co-regulatory protein PtrA N-terminal domain-containing protein n=1 Tax=Pseudomonas sp. NPDC087612 TaxID=3364441 RepID=UPI00381DD253
MSIVRVSSLAILLMLPVVSQAEGGGDRVMERYEKMLEAQVAGRDIASKEEKSVAEQSELKAERKC